MASLHPSYVTICMGWNTSFAVCNARLSVQLTTKSGTTLFARKYCLRAFVSSLLGSVGCASMSAFFVASCSFNGSKSGQVTLRSSRGV